MLAEELETLLKDNLVIALIDPHVIRGDDGSSGHFVVVFDSKNGNFVYHDPGLPALENARAAKEIFMKASKGEFLTVPRNK
jgi:hypothetical protein